MHENRQLLCTFAESNNFKDVILKIKKFYSNPPLKFFVFSNEKAPNEIYITYNIYSQSKNMDVKFPSTISIHRKKQTNTLYTLNAMNQIIRDENAGVFDKTFKVNWELYRNSLIITGEIGTRIISLSLCDILS